MSGLPEHLRSVLAAAAEQLIPAGAGLPSAVEAGIAGHLVDDVLEVRPDLAVPLTAALYRVSAASSDDVLAYLESDTEAFDVLALVVAGGYLMSTEVANALGYPFQEAKLVRSDALFRDIEDGLLDPVLERGPIYRVPDDAPDSHSS